MQELLKEFFEKYEIPKYPNYRQYNYGRVAEGLNELELSLNNGVDCRYIHNTPTEFNDCVYWTEYHYPTLTDVKVVKLLCALSHYAEVKVFNCDENELRKALITSLLENISDGLKKEVMEVFV